jgi:hypothetical protein
VNWLSDISFISICICLFLLRRDLRWVSLYLDDKPSQEYALQYKRSYVWNFVMHIFMKWGLSLCILSQRWTLLTEILSHFTAIRVAKFTPNKQMFYSHSMLGW